MTKAYKKVSTLPFNVEAAFKETMAKEELWTGAAKSTMQLAEDERAKTGELALPQLPYDMVEGRTWNQTCTEVIQNLKPHMPAPKPKAVPKRNADGVSNGEENLTGTSVSMERLPMVWHWGSKCQAREGCHIRLVVCFNCCRKTFGHETAQRRRLREKKLHTDQVETVPNLLYNSGVLLV